MTSAYTYGVSTSCILHTNCILTLADVTEGTGLLDPESVRERLTARPRAIPVRHIFGNPADMTPLCAIAQEHDLKLIEDGSQTPRAWHRAARVGGFGDRPRLTFLPLQIKLHTTSTSCETSSIATRGPHRTYGRVLAKVEEDLDALCDYERTNVASRARAPEESIRVASLLRAPNSSSVRMDENASRLRFRFARLRHGISRVEQAVREICGIRTPQTDGAHLTRSKAHT
jgi:DegT/DnrJ/EryC1/StrS aminotransferase family